jgi:uncharacterized protein YjaZ
MNTGGTKMGVINTDLWLEKHFNDPIELSGKIIQEHRNIKPRLFYRYLLNFGMYKPNYKTQSSFNQLKQENVWDTVEQLYKKYQQKWEGPDIPVYIFPQASGYRPIVQESTKRSGLSFPDKLFLFLTPKLETQAIEAILVHEYHHICRMKKGKKELKNYSLLDSIILEGLAENAVEETCGKDFVARWCHLYTEKQILTYWKQYLEKNLSITKGHLIHDRLLFGKSRVPAMLGYAAGYTIIAKYKQNNSLKMYETFTMESSQFLTTDFLKKE